MSTRYFDLSDDVYLPGRWEMGKLVDPREDKDVWPWLLKKGEPVRFQERPVAPDVQLIPVDLQGPPDAYFILNALRVVKCIDDASSTEVRYWAEADGLPDKVGNYSSVSGMRIEPTKVGDAKVFRTWGWHVALIVSEDIKVALERIGATGTTFLEV